MSAKPMLEAAAQRQLAVDLFNFVWQLLRQPRRTQEEADLMVHAAHASRFHWGEVGTPVNLARGEWQVSRVYAVLERPASAAYHAQRCLEICQQNGVGDFDLAFAYEALARAAAVAGNQAERNEYLALAEAAGRQIADDEDREAFFEDLGTIP